MSKKEYRDILLSNMTREQLISTAKAFWREGDYYKKLLKKHKIKY